MDALPPELLRHFIPFLPLTSLIAARGVSTKWRSLAFTAFLHPACKTLLDLYLAAIVHPNFPSIVEALQPHVHEFDHEAYLADLTSRECVLQNLFELWVLEWPSKAVHFLAWPWLASNPDVRHPHYCDEGNPLGGSPPTVDTIPVPKKNVATVGSQTCLGLLLYSIGFWSTMGGCELWLVVDANERINDRQLGRLIWTYANCLPASFTLRPKWIFYGTIRATYRL